MSGDTAAASAISFPGRSAALIAMKNSGTAANQFAGDSTSAVEVSWFQITEIAGGTSTLTLDLFDGTTAYPFHPAAALIANQELMYGRGWYLPKGWFLRATCSVTANISIVGLQTIPQQTT